ncbi:hypothetical protein A2631_02975 [Candidatus Daviesbacteria bacterium RIFCSPHIGHO2_01_FULL_44_29]|uniref:Glycosyltransferase 2-like domain-containing protein n=1 Tax=Candidatus Daviesbacteria bacterium RIFCSPHIGHO2_02_FULL_43_12 TaxID=1797776 RepID=A0A1F5KK84_9BACT|nr:MAG: hypothetical protein A2631_02975 [Candidatus Daviesbacteria bacterium RIFCSPHIGHO2_01_FULL_44_29]OGE40800.1 MAG: hypothetical protein A3E86_02370 [Candidatus Daviesbacteria bacterium RIFCSPHIGHO2_12_FULL_47_45]OGE41347.1 MAG: hypothetical protein A3D25_02370 [Candidatus Daviesbacteria bacterium RIFCSPHIGHO2_02_FULL_43_12]OGE69548.1 MAG: hypothetical protein A3B55_04115 [Candidatus Daviesbacteria bacterium RIFCSPLOWO2_01_FULL_43_15]
MNKISVVINTLNEEQNIKRVLSSVQWADEVVVCDMYSDDKTVEIAKEMGAKVVFHKKTGYVEPARNFAISQAQSQWILLLDADEEVPSRLAEKIKEIVSEDGFDFVLVPRKNIIFGKWMEYSGWWPDFNIRLFKRGQVTWKEAIHSKPQTQGKELRLGEDQEMALTHHHYESIAQFLERMNRYTGIQAKELKDSGYVFNSRDLIKQPLDEFLGRFFGREGYRDGLHGFVLSLLQAFSFLVVYLKVWENQGFSAQDVSLGDLNKETKKAFRDTQYWIKLVQLPKSGLKRYAQKMKDLLTF